MSGGKGGKQTSEVKIPKYIEDAARRNLSKADDIAAMGYVPQYGPTVAAFTPMQEAAFRNTADTAGAFGLIGGNMTPQNLSGGMAAPTTYAGGVRGYSSVPMYEDMRTQLKTNAPKQYDYLRSFSIDPVTGAKGSRVAPALAPAPVSRASRKILCCAYYNLGYLPREIWRLDQRYGVWLHRHDPELMRGYHAWAAPLADFVQEDTAVARTVRAILWPIVKAWAEEMAHKQRPDKYKANIAGKAITFVGEAFSRLCGKLKPRSIEGAV